MIKIKREVVITFDDKKKTIDLQIIGNWRHYPLGALPYEYQSFKDGLVDLNSEPKENKIAKLIKNRDSFFCAKCREPLKSEFAQCQNKCYPKRI